MRIPIKALKEFSKKFDLSHIIVFGRDNDGKTDRVATYGKTVEFGYNQFIKTIKAVKLV